MNNGMQRAASALSAIDPGCPRQEWVTIGMAAKAAGLSFDQFHEWSRGADNYQGEHDCRSAWNSFKDGAVTENTLFKMAFDQGWQDTAKGTGNGLRGLQAANDSPPYQHAADNKITPARPANRAASRKASDVWDCCDPAPTTHAYLKHKGLLATGLRVYPPTAPPLIIDANGTTYNVANWLAVPYRELDGTLQTIQFISSSGGKLNLPGGHFNDSFFAVGDAELDAEGTGCIDITEGIGAAGACYAATGAAAVATAGSGRMRKVAAILRARFPTKRLRLMADRGKEEEVRAIAREFNCSWVELPDDKPCNYDVHDYAIEYGTDALEDLLKAALVPEIELPLDVVFADALPEDFTPIDELVEGMLTAGGGSVIYGDSNCGKTFFAIDLACAVAQGVPWMDKRTEQGLVIYLATESPTSVCNRLQAYQKHHGVRVSNFAVVRSPIDLFEADADTEALIATIRQLEAQQGRKARLIIGDTLARLSAGANENAGQDMSLVVRRVDDIRAKTGAHFLLVHHCGKKATLGQRGWSGVKAAIDTEIEITSTDTGHCAEITKQRDLNTKGERIGFRLEQVPLGKTIWGTPATSCVVVHADAPEKLPGKQGNQQKLGENQRIAMDALAEPLRSSREFGKGGAPADRPCIRWDDAVSIVAERIPCEAKRRVERAKTAIRGLLAKKFYGFQEDWMWRN